VPVLTERGILLTHTPGVLTETTADNIFTLLAATARRVAELDRMVREGRWTATIGSECFGMDIHHKTIGIVGLGRIGLAVAKRAHGFSMPIVYTDVLSNDGAEKIYGARRLPLEDLLRTADFVCLTVQSSPETRRMINKKWLALMKPTAILINGARGDIVDEAALAEALQARQIRAAGLDVFEKEPLPLHSPLMKLDNVVLLPHIGSATAETRYAMMVCAVDNMIASLNGTLKENCVNKELLTKK
jgi:gluconate 2-dehydrogenase